MQALLALFALPWGGISVVNIQWGKDYLLHVYCTIVIGKSYLPLLRCKCTGGGLLQCNDHTSTESREGGDVVGHGCMIEGEYL